jgi:hypothetical protein
MPTWVKNAIDAWTAAVNITEGHLFRPVNRRDRVRGERMSEKTVWQMLKRYVVGAGLPNITPHDLRPTTAKLCRAAGGELEQIQLLLGHSSAQTTERYLGTRQDFAPAPNDAIKLKLDIKAGICTPARRKPMLVDIAEFIQLPQGVLPVICPALVWLKLPDDQDSVGRHVFDARQEHCLALRTISFIDRKHRVPTRITAA